MGITKFQVLFDNSSKSFTSGQSVTGRLLLSVNSPKRMRGISICFKGEALTKWEVTKETKTNEGNTVHETIQNTGHEIYFENKFNLVGGPSGDTTVQMGDHYYPFNTILPPNLPASYEGKFGHVCYSVKALMDCPGEPSSETQEKFTIICPLDLNEQATLTEPVHLTKEHFFGCCCCESGPLTMVASLPASGYVPGQEIPVTVEVDNISQEEISRVMVTLRQLVKFVATFPEKNEKSDQTDVTAVNFGSVGKNGSETWTKNITVPSLPASNLKLCSIIDIKYELKIVAVVAGICSSNVTIKVPITIGTVPLGEVANISGIVIHFKGEAFTKWDETRKTTNSEGQDVNETVNYTGNETYFENKYNLIGGASGEITLQPGELCYPFNTVLPPNLPSSFEGEFGTVRYTVKAIVDRPWKFDQEAKAAFTVISPLDLNLHPTAKDPVKLTQEKFFCCCCCKSGPLTLVASLPCSGYVSGQQIPVTVEVDNISQEEISNVTVTLRKHLIFTATSPSKEVKRDRITIGEINLGSVGKNGSKTWREVFPIPPLPPSNLANCGLIDLEYDLKIEGKVSGMCHRNVDIKIPLVFGTVPLANFQPPVPLGEKEPIRNGSEDNIMPSAPIGMQGPTDVSGQGWEMPPPSQGQPLYPTQPPNEKIPDSDPQGIQLPPGSGYPGMPPQGMGYPAMPPQGMGYPAMPPQGTGYPGIPPQGMPNNPPAANLYPNLPPPSYAESTTGAKNIQDAGDNQYVQGNLDFTPRYPTYNYPNPYATTN